MRTLVISSGTVSIRGGSHFSSQFSYCSFCTAAHMDRVSNHGSPGRMEDNPSWPSAGGNNFKCTPPQEVEEVSKPHEETLSLDQTNLITLSLCLFPGGFPQPAAHFGGLYGLHSAYGSHARLVLVRLSASGGCVSCVPQDSTAFACAQHTDSRRYTQFDQCPSIGKRSSIGLDADRGCAALCARRIQCALLAGTRFQYAWSSLLSAHQCADPHGSVLSHCGDCIDRDKRQQH